MHLADTFIRVNYLAFRVNILSVMHFLGIEPMTLALLAPCFELQECL